MHNKKNVIGDPKSTIVYTNYFGNIECRPQYRCETKIGRMPILCDEIFGVLGNVGRGMEAFGRRIGIEASM